ncbi:SDR family NAD(P)-dependent oxidoreductase [Mycobacteroides chelonae]|uniref:Short-chain dehydrogenase n=1 Tax=Mycobacteroides chelonae TaxID=1774 RepID=A0A1S1LW47_MYCCH|nr:SDR family NAD(P)-dependent oxidoreductase [Mycobacteroides chelonae]OHU32259.1 short-chain dehydrogenase [Mycobacteroides chelonae]OHU65059.1 short-chain dehydrogenase [Mycobacteroides chelonae]OHU76559.1 short-chain dehydrogenase [Mycobacteroides chelonae]QQG87906.1 SDR family NAD(P)-dependent oxidoreductase [Mycobacteroides chelonae]QQG92723.1 SDR family NAD(P)-dependent oxidoreductase [Mycobacteroides chelonae]
MLSSAFGPEWLRQYGPWAVVAGASEGIGAEFALMLAEAGMNLVLVARTRETLEGIASECGDHGVQVRVLSLDLTHADCVSEISSATVDIEIGLLVYNAGANTHSAEFIDGDLAEFRRVIDLNVTAPLALIHRLCGPMRERRRGGVVLVGSLSGYLGAARHTVYGGVKAFARIFAEGLWLELREYNVHVLELVLGVTDTPAMRRIGLNLEVPGMHISTAKDVAAQGLTSLPQGPIHVASGNENNPVLQPMTDRAQAILASHRMMQKLIEGTAPHSH